MRYLVLAYLSFGMAGCFGSGPFGTLSAYGPSLVDLGACANSPIQPGMKINCAAGRMGRFIDSGENCCLTPHPVAPSLPRLGGFAAGADGWLAAIAAPQASHVHVNATGRARAPRLRNEKPRP